jgi:hypothetical protein
MTLTQSRLIKWTNFHGWRTLQGYRYQSQLEVRRKTKVIIISLNKSECTPVWGKTGFGTFVYFDVSLLQNFFARTNWQLQVLYSIFNIINQQYICNNGNETWGAWREETTWGEQGVGEKIMNITEINMMRGCGLDSTSTKHSLNARVTEHINEPSGPVRE